MLTEASLDVQLGMTNVFVGTFLSAMGGTCVMFFAPMIDLGLVQNPMFARDDVA